MPHTMSISFDKFMEILEEELPVYGDFLRFYKNKSEVVKL